MIRIAVDLMGSDHGVSELMSGIARLSIEEAVHLILVGDVEQISSALEEHPYQPANIEIVSSQYSISQEDDAAFMLKNRSGSSIDIAAELVAKGRADALVTAGNSAAVILSSSRHFNRLDGVRRVAFTAVLPTERRRGLTNDPFALLLDVGATLHVEAEDLVNFALMGSVYAQIISKNAQPRIALLSNGSEATKGAPEVVQAHRFLDKTSLNFIGNVEGLDIPRGNADVIVCEGFMGNVVLKLLEGITELVADLAQDAYERKWVWRVGLTMLSKELQKLKKLTDWKQYGGAPILGFDQIVIKAHGRSNARAIRNAVKIAQKAVEEDLIARIQKGLAEIKGDSHGDT